METALKRLSVVAVFLAIVLVGSAANAQQIDFAFGVGTISSAAATTNSSGFHLQSLTGGAYPAISGDFLLHKNFGIGGEIAWRGSEGSYAGIAPYRPLFWDFDAMYIPRLSRRLAAELSAGIGAESIRFYTPYFNCGFAGCTNYTTSTHFLGQFGGGLKIYVHGGLFVRPEAHFYLINNNVEFSSNHAVRYGGSIGYTFGGR
jgi:hypothetical protein